MKSVFFQTHVDQDLIFDPSAGRNTLSTGSTRTGWAGSMRALGTFFDIAANATVVRAMFDDTGLLVPYVPDIVLRGDAVVFHDLPWKLAHRTVRAVAGYGVSYVGRRPLPYGDRSDIIFLSDASVGVGWTIFDLKLSGAEPLRRPVPPRRVQLRVELPLGAGAHARPGALLHRRRSAHRPPLPVRHAGRQLMRLAPLLGGVALVALGAAAASCNGSTGNALVTFTAYAQGASGAAQPFTAGGYSIQLTRAKMLIGAVYVDESPLGNQAGGPECIAPDLFAAQVPGPVEVDLLSGQPQEFSVYGQGTLDTGLSWQMWLTDGDVNEANHSHVVDLQGTATRIADGTQVPSSGRHRHHQRQPPRKPGDPGPARREPHLQAAHRPHRGRRRDARQSRHADRDGRSPLPWFQLGFSDFASLPAVESDACVSGDTTVPVDPAADYGSAQVCIPNTNYASGAGALEGQELFTSILTGGGAAYSVSFASP